MENKIAKKTIFLGLMLICLTFVVFLTLKLISQRQEIRKRATGTGKVKVALQPTGSVKRGETITVNIILEATEKVEIGTGGVDLEFKPNFFSISKESLNCNSSFLPNKAIGNVNANKISLTCYTTPPFPYLNAGQKVTLGTFQVRVLDNASDQTEIRFLRTEVVDISLTDISDQGTPGTYKIKQETAPISSPTPIPSQTPTFTPALTPSQTNTPTPTPTLTPGQVKVSFKVKFSGIDSKKPDQIVKVKIGRGETIVQQLEKVNLTANNQGIYESQMITLSSAVISGTNYYLLVKGPKHLQIRFCQNSGQIRPCTTGRISLQSGENILDFTGYPLPGGDLPPQDGLVNAIDAVALVNCLFKNNPDCLQKADLNFDEIVNTLDINIMNNTIYSRWEDE